MKLNCILSDTTLGGHKALFGLLREQNDGTGRHIFLVPDRYTLGVEREICETLYPDGTFNVDVCSFTRLAQKALGRKNKACLSKEGTVLLLNRVIEEKNDELLYYKDVRSVSFSREMFASIASLRSSGVSADDAEEIGKRLCSPDDKKHESLGRKLHDVALLYRAYEEKLRKEYFDTVTRVEWLIENVGKSDVTKGSHIYVLGFNVFSDLQMAFIKQAMLFCASVSVSFCKSEKGSNGHCFPAEQREKLLSYAALSGIPTRTWNVTEVLPPVFSFLHDEAFGTSQRRFQGDTSAVSIARYDNAYEEVKAVAREIVYLTREKNVRFRDVAIACNNEKYTPVLRKTFARYDITFFIDEKYYVKNGFFARLIRSALAAVDGNLDVRDVTKLVRHPYMGFSRDEIQTFENYCVRYSVDHSLFTKPFENDDVAENVRRRTIERLQLPKTATVGAYCDAIAAWAADEEIAERERAFGRGETTEERVYADKEKFLTVVKEIALLCGDALTDVGGFADMLASVLEEMTTSVLPQYVDSVFIGNTSESRFNGVKVLFVVGANDGYFPVTTGDKLIFGCYDTEVMKANGLRVFPSPEESNFFEQFAVIDLMTKPERLYVSYTSTNENGETASEGRGVRELKYRLNFAKDREEERRENKRGERAFEEAHGFTAEEKLLYRLATPQNAYFEYTAGYVPAEYRESVRRFLVREGYLVEREEREEGYDLLRGYARTKEGAYKLSVSKMERYFHCPFANYVYNVLSLREKEESGLKVNDKGQIIHAVLEGYFSDAEALRTMTPDERAKKAERCIQRVMNDPQYRRFEDNYMAKREMESIARECRAVCRVLTDNVLHSSFTPTMLEKRIGDKGEIAFTDGEDTFLFTGIVDRVDQSGDRIVVVDYKTGTTKPELKNVYLGNKIQLYLYLKYFLDQGKYEVAGVFYMPISDGYTKEGVSYALQGQMIEDTNLFFDMDDRVNDTQNTKYDSPNIDFSLENKKGSWDFTRRNKDNRLQKEDFPMVSEYVLRLVKQAIREIREGTIDKKPVKGGCEFCVCKKICGEVPEREGVTAKIESFAETDGGTDDAVE